MLEKPSSRDSFEAKYDFKKCTSKKPPIVVKKQLKVVEIQP
jgi:hypothetical protein